MFGEDNPCAHPRNTGWWNVFNIKPFKEAQQLLDIRDTWQHGWIGDGAASMYSIFDRGQAVVLMLAGRDRTPGDARTRAVSADEIREMCHDWPPRLSKAMETVRIPKLLVQRHEKMPDKMQHAYSSSARNPSRPRCIFGSMRSRLLPTILGLSVC